MLPRHSLLFGLLGLGVALAAALPSAYDQYGSEAWNPQQVDIEYDIGEQQQTQPRFGEELREAQESQQYQQSDDMTQESQQYQQSDDLSQDSQQDHPEDVMQQSQQNQESSDFTQETQYQQRGNLTQETQQDQSDDLTQQSQQNQESSDLTQETQYQQTGDLTQETQQDQSEDLKQQDQESDDLFQQSQQTQEDQVSGWELPNRRDEGIERVRDQQSAQYTQGEPANDEWGRRVGSTGNAGSPGNPGSTWNRGNSGNPGNSGSSWNGGNSGNPGNSGSSWNGGNSGNPGNPGSSWNGGNSGNPGNTRNNSDGANSWNGGTSGIPGNTGITGNPSRPLTPPSGYDKLPNNAFTPLGFYKIYTHPKTWTEALMICVNDGAELVFPRSKQEAIEIGSKYASVKKDVKGSTDKELFFIGASDLANENDFITLEGDHFKNGFYHHWQKGEPNNHKKDEHCVLSNDKGFYWDGNCKSKYAFVCRFKADPCVQPPRPVPSSGLGERTTY